jgi:antibiotic biosynthesis monooxygenase (ABM) superfamily enzyme
VSLNNNLKMGKLKNLISNEPKFVKVEDKNRFYYMLQQMQSNRWKITGIVLFLFFFIILGINSAVFFGINIKEDWKEMLLILLGAFVGNLNKVVDYWFNSEDRDKMLIQKVDEEDGVSLSSTTDTNI